KYLAMRKIFGLAIGGRIIGQPEKKIINKKRVSTIKCYTGTKYDGGG
ncbi:MAG: hypothetical protein H6Q04_3084, partial [Acidobacteria bacterium]|nr:hypothetical protein [Acidobacteriota bacterium]